ncbi:TIGR04282 family arsenosugar biosynthesis glycosyltransferase [Aquimarina algicola]|uniref:DUF2064 domain-containing protein n=1 Tax=Aquimarina algicola TaxID=2589995 RepID=A0A504JHF1_9FLAO|nr:DUF2064 domain-containing protein [Aquimarina algicola]TPN87238.1 DUF2064 domain-containing protein [Aquimarina algicola]
MNQKTAILVFANSSEEEIRHKPISGGKQLFSALNAHTQHIVKSTALPYFVYTENEQQGHTFGERFVNAIQDIYDKGFENVITIGNDTPHLQKKHLLETVKQLKSNTFVLGPSTDGGFYLMGLHKSQFKIDVLLRLPWQSRELSDCIQRWIRQSKIEVISLEVLEDIDTVKDLKSVFDSFKTLPRELITIIQKILNHNTQCINTCAHYVYSYHILPFFNKGSPFITFA